MNTERPRRFNTSSTIPIRSSWKPYEADATRNFPDFEWKGEPPDPQDDKTFQRSKTPNDGLKNHGRHRVLLNITKS